MNITFFDTAISLDGFMAGDNRSAQNTIGDGGMALHNWMFIQKAFWEHLGMEDGSEDSADGELIRQTIARAGSCIMGKRMFEEGEPNWPENLFKSDVFVLTHEKRTSWVQKGSTTFYFINDGIESAFEKAKKSAKDKDIRIMGGANVIQQFLNAGLVDEFILHITPIILGSGIRLFDHVDKNRFDIQTGSIVPASLTTHINYKLTNK